MVQASPPNGGVRRNQGIAGRMIGAVVGPLVSPVVDQVDVDDVVNRIDIEHVLDRIDIDAVLDRIDIDAVLERIDVDHVLARMDVNVVLDRVDINRVVARIQIDPVIDRIDFDHALARIDLDKALARVDMNQLLARMDLNVVLDRLDVDRLVARMDIDQIIDRVDINRVLERVDIDSLVERTELGSLITKSTSGVIAHLLDVLRSTIVSADVVVASVVDRIMRRDQKEAPPAEIVVDVADAPALAQRDVALQGRPAGAVSRVLGFLIDWFLIGAGFVAGERLFSLAWETITGNPWTVADHQVIGAVWFALWAFVYFAVPIAFFGRTVGQALLGIKVLMVDGSRVDARHAAIRTAAMPLSFVLFGAGLFLGLFRADRRTLHDLIGRTSVIYAWDARAARLRFLAAASNRQPEIAG